MAVPKPSFDKDAYFRQLDAALGQPQKPVVDRNAILQRLLKPKDVIKRIA
jgi:hypothetical protein